MAFLNRMTLSLPAAWAVSVVNALPPSWLERKRKRDLKTSLRLASTRAKFYREKFSSSTSTPANRNLGGDQTGLEGRG